MQARQGVNANSDPTKQQRRSINAYVITLIPGNSSHPKENDDFIRSTGSRSAAIRSGTKRASNFIFYEAANLHRRYATCALQVHTHTRPPRAITYPFSPPLYLRPLFTQHAFVARSSPSLAGLYHPLHVRIAPAEYIAASKYCIMEMRLLELHNSVLHWPNASSNVAAANSPAIFSEADYCPEHSASFVVDRTFPWLMKDKRSS